VRRFASGGEGVVQAVFAPVRQVASSIHAARAHELHLGVRVGAGSHSGRRRDGRRRGGLDQLHLIVAVLCPLRGSQVDDVGG